MNFDETMLHVFKSNDFNKWYLNTDINKLKLPNALAISISNKCNLHCKHCCVGNEAETIINFDKFFNFFELYLIELEKNKVDIFNVDLTGGEITTLDISLLLKFLHKILILVKKYNIRLQLNCLSNLVNIKSDHLKFFKSIKEINDFFNTRTIIKTSCDQFHFNYKFYKIHLENVKKINSLGIPVVLTTVITGNDEEVIYVKEKYKELNIIHRLFPLTTYDDMDKHYSISKDIINACNRNPLLYKDIHQFKTSNFIYNHTDELVLHIHPNPCKELSINVDSIKNIEDIYNHNLFLWREYIYGSYALKYPNILCSNLLLHYYRKFIKQDLNTTNDLKFNLKR